jgi:SAM-dependent methyltransferase
MDDMYRDGTYQESNPTWHEGDAPWKARQVQGILTDNKVTFTTVAEVGCGTGEILVQLSGAFPNADFSGYDISPQAIEIAVRRARPRVQFHLKDLLQDPDAEFDVVLIADVIEHVEDYIGFVKGVKRLGTWKVFHIPLDISVQSLIRMWPILNLRESVGHIHYFTMDTAIALLRDCGYKIIDWRYTASRLELPDQALSSRVVAPVRKLLHSIIPDLTVRILGGYSLLVLAE